MSVDLRRAEGFSQVQKSRQRVYQNRSSKVWLQWLERRSSWAAAFSFLALGLVVGGMMTDSPAQAEPTLLQAAVVDIAVVPSSKTVKVNDTFTLDIYVYPNGQEVDAVDADLTFEPAYLEVQGITGNASGLEYELYNDWNNADGKLTHSRGASFGQTLPTSAFRLCTILLTTKAATDGTTLAFTGDTGAYGEAGCPVLRSTTDGTVIIISPYPPGDLDQDCDVDVEDIMLVASRWHTYCDNVDPDNDPDTPNYDPQYDFDEDCDIDIVDIMLVVIHWGKTC